MKLIKKISGMIDDEIEGVKCYAKMAVELKDEMPGIAEEFYDLSKEEARHYEILHNIVVKLIEDYRKENGEPPVAMQNVYDYLHEQSIEKMADAKRYQDMYK